MHAPTHAWTHAHTGMHTHKHIQLHTHTCTYAHTHECMNTHAVTCIHTHMHKRHNNYGDGEDPKNAKLVPWGRWEKAGTQRGSQQSVGWPSCPMPHSSPSFFLCLMSTLNEGWWTEFGTREKHLVGTVLFLLCTVASHPGEAWQAGSELLRLPREELLVLGQQITAQSSHNLARIIISVHDRCACSLHELSRARQWIRAPSWETHYHSLKVISPHFLSLSPPLFFSFPLLLLFSLFSRVSFCNSG